MAFYQRIRDLREDADKTQTEIAKYLGTTAQYYGKYESGERELPFARAIQLAVYYGVSLDYLAGLTNEKSLKKGALTVDQLKLCSIYDALSEKNKGKLELFAGQLLRSQRK